MKAEVVKVTEIVKSTSEVFQIDLQTDAEKLAVARIVTLAYLLLKRDTTEFGLADLLTENEMLGFGAIEEIVPLLSKAALSRLLSNVTAQEA